MPSSKFFNDYLKNSLSSGERIEEFKFRDKTKQGWGMNAKLVYYTKNKKLIEKIFPARTSSYFTFFLDGEIYRESCYSCLFACVERVGDISIGDYWGIEKEHPKYLEKDQFNERNGISCVLVNTNKGQVLVEKLKERITFESSRIEQIARRNMQLIKPSSYSDERKTIFEKYRTDGYYGVENYFTKKYGWKILIHKGFNLMPRKVRSFIKKFFISNLKGKVYA